MPGMRWTGSIIHHRWLPFLVVIAGFVAMLTFYGPTDNWMWDPSFYYAQLRSPIIDHDLDFRPETLTHDVEMPVTPTGVQGSPWPVGPSIFWSPFFLLAHLIVMIIDPAKATGFSSPYIALVSFGSAMYGLLGLLALYRLCRFFGDKFITLLTVLLCLAATPLFYYIFRQPIMAHSPGFLVATVMFLYYVQLIQGRAVPKWSGMIFGVLLGLNFLMRWSGLLFVVFPAAYYSSQLLKAMRTKDSRTFHTQLIHIAVACLSFLLTISPQLALWQRLYGSFLVIPQGPEAFVSGYLPVNFFNIFFHTNRGLLFWSPFVLLGMVGLFLIPHPQIRWSSILCFFLQLVVIGYRVDWFSGGGFGARYFVELLPLIAIGFINLLRGFPEKPAWKASLLLFAAALILHQSVLMYAVEHTANAWLDIESYLKGRPLGLHWQADSFLQLLKHPGLWLEPRSFIITARQAILVNLLDEVKDYRAYLVTGAAAALAPLGAIIVLWLPTRVSRFNIPLLLSLVTLFMVGWAIIFLLVDQ